MTSQSVHDQLPSDLVGTDFGVVVVSDVACPWARVALHRLAESRRRRGVTVELPIDHRAFPLELVNRRPTPMPLLSQEITQCRGLESALRWSDPDDAWTFPVSSLPALEAVQAAKAQGAAASAALDLALRDAMFTEWRCISVFPVVLDIAGHVDGLDVDRLRADIVDGRARTEIWRGLDELVPRVPGSPTFVLPDGSVTHNPGVEIETSDEHGPTVTSDDPSAVDDLVHRALALRRAD